MKFGIKQYMKPTPANMRRLGDALLAITTLSAPIAVIYDQKWMAILIFTCGVLGKFITNFWGKD